jgi:hypothetical protein
MRSPGAFFAAIASISGRPCRPMPLLMAMSCS